MSENTEDDNLGEARIEAAYGSGDGDEDISATVASAPQGQILEQVYRPWDGPLGPRWVRNYAIYRHHVYGIISGSGHRRYHPFVRLTLLVVILGSMTPILMLLLSSMISGDASGFLNRMWGVNRYNLWGNVLGYFPRNLCMWPLLTALVVGGLVSDDRRNGTSALYFSRPVSRLDYALMKWLSAASVLAAVILLTYMLYYSAAVVFKGEGWSFIADTIPIFMGGLFAGLLLVITYTSIGIALSSISTSRFTASVSFLGLVLGSKIVAWLVELQFETTYVYLLSPYDCLAHLGQWLVGLPLNYDHSLTLSIVSLLAMNAAALSIFASRVSSLEVTRE